MGYEFETRIPYDFGARRRYLDLPFPTSEYESRLRKIREMMEREDLSAFVGFGDQNDFGILTYVAAFEPMMGRGAVVITKDAVSLVTDSAFHGEPMHSLIWRTWVEDVVLSKPSLPDFISSLKTKLPSGKVGVAGTYAFSPNSIGLNTVGVDNQFLEIKSRKTPLELDAMREASRITSKGMQAAVKAVKLGIRETELAAIASRIMFEEGAERLAFHPIVVAGDRSGMKHDFPTSRKIQNDEMVYIDIGAISRGYFSDMSRTVLVGKGTPEQRNALETIFDIYTDLKRMIKPGVEAKKVAKQGEYIAQSRGWLRDFWAMGHGLGTSFLELPAFTPSSVNTFAEGMVFAYEPMIVRLGLGTAVIEDTLALTVDGHESLTDCETRLW
ncbi:MAG TPA: Xaa-Pro peptidase family protein [Terriglobales bacterium]|nr:Xaa-Pro peptidase family protein [Terriglobales bacterium]